MESVTMNEQEARHTPTFCFATCDRRRALNFLEHALLSRKGGAE